MMAANGTASIVMVWTVRCPGSDAFRRSLVAIAKTLGCTANVSMVHGVVTSRITARITGRYAEMFARTVDEGMSDEGM